jgi:GTPase SAR1 family protein
LEGLSNLSSLDLRNTQISKIENLEGLSNLSSLYLSHTPISKIENLEGLSNLKTISLRNNAIKYIPKSFIYQENLIELELQSKSIENIPYELLQQENCLQDVRQWFADLEKGKQENYEIKMIICGNGRVGKTTLQERLRIGKYNEDLKTTHGILLEQWYPKVNHQGKEKKVTVNIWDFGGQEIYHATHRFFMQSRALYLIVWDKETYVRTNYEEGGEIYKNYRLEYWLDYVRSYSKESPAIVIENKIDDTLFRKVVLDEPKLRKLYKSLDFQHVSVYSGKNMRALEATILERIEEFPELGMEMPTSWYNVRIALQALSKSEKDIPYQHFEEVCLDQNVSKKSIPIVLRYLHDTGNIFYQKDLFRNRIILDQKWAIEGIYALFDRNEMFYELRKDEGRFTKSNLTRYWSSKSISEEKHDILISFMESCEICFRKDNDDKSDNPIFIAPLLLQEEMPIDVENIWKQNQGETWCFQYKHPVLHRSFIHRFIVRTGQKASANKMWQMGIHLDFQKGKALVKGFFDDNDDGFIEIRVTGQDKAMLLHLIKQEFKGIYHQREGDIEQFVAVNDEVFVNVNRIKENLKNKNPKTTAENSNAVDTKKYREIIQEYKPKEFKVLERDKRGEMAKKAKLTDLQVVEKKPIVEQKAKSKDKKILFVTSNPADTKLIDVDEEYRCMQRELEGKKFSIISLKQANKKEFIRKVLDDKPDIIHFSAHGHKGDEKLKQLIETCEMDISDGSGIILMDEKRRDCKVFKTEEIERLFSVLSKKVTNLELVFLNACHSERQAKVISQFGYTVIGSKVEIEDDIAIAVAEEFYRQLAKGEDYETAIEEARLFAAIEGANEEDIVLYKNGKKI